MATSVYVSDFKLIKFQLNLKLNKYSTNSSAVYTPKSDFKWQLVFVKLKAQEILQTCQL